MTDSVFSGLVEYLGGISAVKDVKFTRGDPLPNDKIVAWERLYYCALPEDLKQFFLSNNGIALHWNYQYNDSTLNLGRIGVNALNEMIPLHVEKDKDQDDTQPSLLDLDRGNSLDGDDSWKPSFGGGTCKIFSIDYCPTCGHICLVYNTKKKVDEECSIWLLDLSLTWHYFCPSFSDFIRLAVVHLGLFQWPYTFTPYGPSPQYEKWFHLLVPKRLEMDLKHGSPALLSYNSSANAPPGDIESSAQVQQSNSNPVKPSVLQTSSFINHLDSSKVLFSKSLRDRSRSRPVSSSSIKKSQTYSTK